MERLYVIQGVNGLCKVGRTTNLPARIVALNKLFRASGDEILRFHGFDEIAETVHAEKRFIDWAVMASTEYVSGREWFRGLDFDAALVAGARITAAHAHQVKVTAAEKRERVRQYKEIQRARRAHDKALIDNWRAQGV